MGLPNETVLLVVKVLYGIQETGFHWYIIHIEYHINKLGMFRSNPDPCRLLKRNDAKVTGLGALKVDAPLSSVDEMFMMEEEESSKAFSCNPRKIQCRNPVAFNGIRMRREMTGAIIMNQVDQIKSLTIPTTYKEFSSEEPWQSALALTVGHISVTLSDSLHPVQEIQQNQNTRLYKS